MDFSEILFRKYPNSQWNLNGDDYEGLEWVSENEKPTESELIALWPLVQSDIKAEQDAKVVAKESVLTKLQALGLTEDEIKALVGA
jgi:hypothetical protein